MYNTYVQWGCDKIFYFYVFYFFSLSCIDWKENRHKNGGKKEELDPWSKYKKDNRNKPEQKIRQKKYMVWSVYYISNVTQLLSSPPFNGSQKMICMNLTELVVK